MTDPTPTASGDLEAAIERLRKASHEARTSLSPSVRWARACPYDVDAILAVIRPANPPATDAGIVKKKLSIQTVSQWANEASSAMESALWEYCPPEFFTLANAYIALLSEKQKASE